MDKTRLDDMLERYGEVCSQATAAKILSIVPRTVARMMAEGKLRKVGRYVDVRSICAYIENAAQINFMAKNQKKSAPKVSREDFLAAARSGRWAARK